ncbi:hypothetical protein APE_1973.1 [Aeropyrum pernix K1]|uniref:Uncharacterized protein n=1 Tax=Aeropyrum pernix (strain ATCC 700893 / DSM 11879 / JCM 9820 / NBRC 100138 / K1) TaxID=272557 RepID=Q9YAG6_AERPE|nr:hypothetical protein [Aeropyrum pernix]BAA80983.2 hypothetical protein APE_1973.1 [Aeropyrum pernix K1]
MSTALRGLLGQLYQRIAELMPFTASIIIGVLGGIGLLVRVAPSLEVVTSPGTGDGWRFVAAARGLGEFSNTALPMLASMLETAVDTRLLASLLPPLVWLAGVIPVAYVGYVAAGRSPVGAVLASILYTLSPTIYAVTVAGRLYDGTLAMLGLALAFTAIALAVQGRATAAGLAALAAGLIWPANGYSAATAAALLMATAAARDVRILRGVAAAAGGILLGGLLAGSLWEYGLTFDVTMLLLAALVAVAAAMGLARPPLGFWASTAAVTLSIFALLAGVADAPPEVEASLNLAPPTADTILNAAAGPARLESLLRESALWATLAAAGLLYAAYRFYSSASLGSEELLAASLLAALAAAAIYSLFNGEMAPQVLVALAPLSAYAVNGLKRLGLTGEDEMGRVIIISLAIALILSTAYLGQSIYAAFQGYEPTSLSIAPNTASPWPAVIEYLNSTDGATVIANPVYKPLIESMAGVRFVNDEFDVARVLAGTEGGANYVLRDVLSLKPGDAYVVVFEGFLGIYDVNNGLLALYPRPVAQSFQEAGIFFIVNGVYDLNSLFNLLKAGEMVDESVDSPFQTPWASRIVSPGLRVEMFPGLTGEPAENVERVQKTLLVKLLADAVYSLGGEETVFGDGCGFIAGTPSPLLAVFTPTPTGGGQLQPVFTAERPYSFTPLVISMVCPQILSETAERIEFYAEIAAVYVWTG